MTDRTLLVRAAEILDREANVLHQSYVVSTMTSDEPVWDDQDAKRDHDEMLEVAAALRKEAS